MNCKQGSWTRHFISSVLEHGQWHNLANLSNFYNHNQSINQWRPKHTYVATLQVLIVPSKIFPILGTNAAMIYSQCPSWGTWASRCRRCRWRGLPTTAGAPPSWGDSRSGGAARWRRGCGCTLTCMLTRNLYDVYATRCVAICMLTNCVVPTRPVPTK